MSCYNYPAATLHALTGTVASFLPSLALIFGVLVSLFVLFLAGFGFVLASSSLFLSSFESESYIRRFFLTCLVLFFALSYVLGSGVRVVVFRLVSSSPMLLVSRLVSSESNPNVSSARIDVDSFSLCIWTSGVLVLVAVSGLVLSALVRGFFLMFVPPSVS